MLTFEHGKGIFNCRAAALILYRGRLLLHTSDRDEFWSLPGGRVEFGEAAAETLVREMEEELGESVIPGPLCWLVENFYTWAGRPHHELCFYYRCTLPADSPLPISNEWNGRDGELELTFRWFSRDELAAAVVYPSFIPQKAFVLPETPGIEQFVWRE